MSLILRIIAVVLFCIAALLGFGLLEGVEPAEVLGIVAAGLAAWCGSTLTGVSAG